MAVLKPVFFVLIIIFTVVVIENQCGKYEVSPEEKKVCDEIDKQREDMKKQREKVEGLIDRITAAIERDMELYSCSAETEGRNFQFSFPQRIVEDYVSLNLSSSAPSLDAFTLCQWIKIGNKSDGGTLFSYSLPGEDNELLLIDYSSDNFMLFMLGGKSQRIELTANDDHRWHHICATWENIAGWINCYVDGKIKTSVVGFKRYHVIKSGGILILGQDQDEFGGGFELSQSFFGEIFGVNMWSFVVPREEIKRMSESCFYHEGDYLRWSDLKAARLHGDVRITSPTMCSP